MKPDAKDEAVDLLAVDIGSVWQNKQLDEIIVEVCPPVPGQAPDMVCLYDAKYDRFHPKAYFEINIIEFRDLYVPYLR